MKLGKIVRTSLLAGVALTSAVAFATPAPALAASLGNSEFYPYSDGTCRTKVFSSNGGVVKLTFYWPGSESTYTNLDLWEYDPDNPDDFVDNVFQIRDGQSVTWTNLSSTVDGDNNKAELYWIGPCAGAPWIHIDD